MVHRPYGYVLVDPLLFEKPIPYKGKQGFFELDTQRETA